MEAKFINPFLTTIVKVLSTMAQLQPKPGKPSLKNENSAPGIVTGMIAMDGEQAKGSLAISFTQPVIFDITKRMLRQEPTSVDNMVKDLTGELANMVLGGAKAIFEEEGYDFNLTLPVVLSEPNHTIDHPVIGPKIIMPFTIDSGKFYIEICFEKH